MTQAKADELRALAVRCENANGRNRLLDRDIADAIGLGPDATWARPIDKGGVISMDKGNWVKGNILRRSKPYTDNLDDANQLVPDDWSIEGATERYGDPGPCRIELQRGNGLNPFNGVRRVWAGGKTLTLALCAAALRARAEIEEKSL